jgi:hypothetical protein
MYSIHYSQLKAPKKSKFASLNKNKKSKKNWKTPDFCHDFETKEPFSWNHYNLIKQRC